MRVKLTFWLLTIKTKEKNIRWPPIATCNMALEKYFQGLRHFSWKLMNWSMQELWTCKDVKKWNSHFEVSWIFAISMQSMFPIIKYFIKEKVVSTPPKSKPWWIMWVCLFLWLHSCTILLPIIALFFGLCKLTSPWSHICEIVLIPLGIPMNFHSWELGHPRFTFHYKIKNLQGFTFNTTWKTKGCVNHKGKKNLVLTWL